MGETGEALQIFPWVKGMVMGSEIRKQNNTKPQEQEFIADTLSPFRTMCIKLTLTITWVWECTAFRAFKQELLFGVQVR